jgi:hypothetical protein
LILRLIYLFAMVRLPLVQVKLFGKIAPRKIDVKGR